MLSMAAFYGSLGRATATCGLLVLAAGEAAAEIPASERNALIALYDSTNGAGWEQRTNWRNAADTDFSPAGSECTWYGVTCDPTGAHVTGLMFYSNQLAGSIPPEIGDFTNLTEMNLGVNALMGPIPPEVGRLSALVDLEIYGTQVSGPIPPAIGSLTNLGVLTLASNQLSGSIPAQIGNLTKLDTLQLSGNPLDGSIPPEIGNLSSLRHLYLSSTQLGGSIPPEVGNLTNLVNLELSENQLAGPIPPEIGKLKQLLTLELGNNQLSGSIPPEIGRLANLLWLALDHSQLSGPIPPEIGDLANLGGLLLEDNQLSGSIPTQIGKLSGLGTLSLSNNHLTGPIPASIGNLDGLSYLHLDGNQLTGPIPPGIGRMSNLFDLFLADNRLTGPIPPQIGDLALLLTLRLEGNELTGPIPASLANLTRLVPGGAPGGSDLRWNALYTDDPELRAFLDSKQLGGDWESTQTVAPTDLVAGAPGMDAVPLSWTPIVYTGDAGGYRVWYGTRSGGPYNLAGTTADKTAPAFTVTGFSPGTTYYLALDTVTDPHVHNQNTVVSERRGEVSVTTLAGGSGWYGLAVTSVGPGMVSSSPGGISCGGACAATFAPGTLVTLTAAPEAGSAFLGWGGACAGTALTCELTMDAAQAVTATFSPPATSFYTVTPCRVYDTRDAGLGGPGPLTAGTDTAVMIGGYCGVPATATAVSLNLTVISPTAGGHLRLHAAGTPRPGTSSVNYSARQTRASNAVVSLGAEGAIAVYVNQPSGTAHVVLDVSGYFQ